MTDARQIADDLVERHDWCGQRFATLVAGVRPEQWQNGTPCSEWDVRTLVHHLLYEQLWVPPLLEGLTVEQVGDRFEGDLLGDDASAWPGLLASSIREAHSAVAQPGALDRTVHLSYGDVPGQEYVTQLTVDLAIHGWDLARATGQDDTLDSRAVALLLAWAEANADLVAASGMFGSRIDVAPDAPEDIRLLGLLGRTR
jgi:uncharacterized protein (TIGR03086 family)